MNSIITLALIQQSAFSDLVNSEGKFQQIEDDIKLAAERGADLILLQELHNSPYFCQREDPREFDRAESIPGPSTARLSQQAKKHKVVLVASLFERRQPSIYHNTAVVFDRDGSIAGKYRKMHIPDDPGYHEKFYFTPGDLGFTPIKTSIGRLGVLICWDQWFPEAARLMALAGADILLYPTAIGWDISDADDEQQRQRDAWITVQRGHAIANGLPIAVCNRVGTEISPDKKGSIKFWGSSFIAGPQGELLAQASTENAEIILAQIDTKQTGAVRRIWPFFRDRRIDGYSELLSLARP